MERFVAELGLQARSRIVARSRITTVNDFDCCHFYDAELVKSWTDGRENMYAVSFRVCSVRLGRILGFTTSSYTSSQLSHSGTFMSSTSSDPYPVLLLLGDAPGTKQMVSFGES